MITKQEYLQARNAAADMFRSAGLVISEADIENIEIADFGLSNLPREGGLILSLASTGRISMRVMALLPGQSTPEHWHIGFDGYEGKEETLRVISGVLYLYIPGEDTMKKGKVLEGKEEMYTSRHEIIMNPSDVITMPPGQKHWFQAGPEGVVFYTVSTLAVDSKDPFTDPNVVRKTIIE